MNYWALECFPAGSALLLPWAALGEAAFALRAQFAPSFSGAVGQQADQPGEDLAGSYLCVAGMTPGLMGCPPPPPRASRCSSCAVPTTWYTCTAAQTRAPCWSTCCST